MKRIGGYFINRAWTALMLMIVVAGFTGTAAQAAHDGYADVEYGVVVSSQEVVLRGDGSEGAVAGMVIGGGIGASLGGDTGGSIAGGLAGAVIGGILGSEIDKASGHPGIAYEIRLDSGRTITVIQNAHPYYPDGTRVRVVMGDVARVLPESGGDPVDDDTDEGIDDGDTGDDGDIEDDGSDDDEGAYEDEGEDEDDGGEDGEYL